MNRLTALFFRITIGVIFIAQYFFGGNYGQGNKFLLLIGGAFVVYGLIGIFQRLSKKY